MKDENIEPVIKSNHISAFQEAYEEGFKEGYEEIKAEIIQKILASKFANEQKIADALKISVEEVNKYAQKTSVNTYLN